MPRPALRPDLAPFRRSLLLRLAIGGCLLVALGVGGATFAHDAATGREDQAVPPIGALVADGTLDPRILQLDLSGARWRDAVTELETALFDRADAARRVDAAAGTIVEVRIDRAAVEDELARRRDEAAGLDDRIAAHERAIRRRALDLFVGFGSGTDLEALSSPGDAADSARVQQLADEVDEAQLDERHELLDRRTSVVADIERLEADLNALGRTEARTLDELERAAHDREEATAAIDAATNALRSARLHADVEGLDMSVIALDAYLRAEVAQAEATPRCGIEWWMIAAVGRVESRHGELGGRSVSPDGTVSSPIIGIVLDGGPGVRSVVDTDGGELDGDPVWDRAVGPMQFIPETWRIRGIDGDGDGVADPQNLYDAAATTARYLCRLGGRLSTETGLAAAYFGYNTSTDYVENVRAHAEHYRGFALPARATDQTSAPSAPDAADTPDTGS